VHLASDLRSTKVSQTPAVVRGISLVVSGEVYDVVLLEVEELISAVVDEKLVDVVVGKVVVMD
jgi:hypothetical protein